MYNDAMQNTYSVVCNNYERMNTTKKMHCKICTLQYVKCEEGFECRALGESESFFFCNHTFLQHPSGCQNAL